VSAKPFWETKTLKQMSKQEWESLCDGCARCCLHKLEDEDTDEVYYTDVHCRYMDKNDCSCTVYQTRNEKVPECIWLTPEQAHSFHWLPDTCAYRLVAEGKPLYDWHPLISGDPESVHKSEISLQGKGIPDDKIPEEEWQSRIIWKA
jgi:uncharacterized cysteine cluster protein YcgN (CxxCxxCC family)